MIKEYIIRVDTDDHSDIYLCGKEWQGGLGEGY